MIVERYEFNHWASKHPMFICRSYKDYEEIIAWMRQHRVNHFLWASGSGGYIFDVRGERADWFLLRWS